MTAAPASPERLTLFARVLAAALRMLFRSLVRVRLRIPADLPTQGPLVIVANHLSMVDPPLLAAWLQPALGRPIHFLAKEQLFRTPLTPLLRALGTIPVRAGGSDIEAYRAAQAVLARGGIVAIFPEGTRSPTGSLQRVHPGAAMLALRAGVPILPVGIDGTDRLLPRGSRLPRIGERVEMRVGQPVRLDPDEGAHTRPAAGGGRRAAVEAATERILASIEGLLPPARHRPVPQGEQQAAGAILEA